ncbi:MAG: endopeptidase La [Planctomycetes bacterium]|nr:endopeptidase La [Planctomycetota bacterium]
MDDPRFAPTASKQIVPVLPIKNTVLFPHLFMPLSVGRSSSVIAVEAALADEEKTLLVVAQKESSKDEPTPDDLFRVGTRAVIKKMARSPQTVDILVQGMERVEIVSFTRTEPHLEAEVRVLPLPTDEGAELDAIFRTVVDQVGKIMEVAQAEGSVAQLVSQAGDPLRFVFLVGSMLGLDVAKEQALLEAGSRLEALQRLNDFLAHETQVLELRQKIASRAQTEMSKEQRDYMLRQQMRAIQEELGEDTPEKAEVALLRKRLAEADLPDAVRKETDRELSRLERLPPAAPDFQLIRTYVEFILELPWRKTSPESLDLSAARRILDEDHFDLEDIKARILEHLAILQLNPNAKAPILCLVGPPGVGKTSLGQSIARSMGRAFERASLGGMHDEAELRGHRRTYIGAMPGRILQAIRRAGVNNPLLMLDEVDKLGRDFRGDPASALLEVLDPEQNANFRDNYLDLPFDLSRVFFIATANALDTIPRPLLDRMEILRLAGYTVEEKVEIARRYLVPRLLKNSGLTATQFAIPDETIKEVVTRYTREAGLRQLDQALGRLGRKVAIRFADGKSDAVTVRPEDLAELLGPERFFQEKARQKLPPGVAVGLAWTESGGEVLYVEATLLPGARGFRLTGSLGDVMRESARAAQSYVWSHAKELNVDPAIFKHAAVHVHVPAGAVPKDGPSAGVAMATALTSLYSGIPARPDTAMTGEITLTGLVLPIGGVKEKVLAARAAGIRRVILPKANEKDVQDVPESARGEIEFIFAKTIADVLAAALSNSAKTATRKR